MKHLKLILNFYNGCLIPCIILLFIITMSIFVNTYAIGQYRFIQYSNQIFMHSNLKNAIYVMPDITSFQQRTEQTENLITSVKQLKGVESVLRTKSAICSYNGKAQSISLYNNDIIKDFKLDVLSGTWLDQKVSRVNDQDAINAVIGGYVLDDVPVDSHFKVQIFGNSGDISSLSINAIGKLRFPSYIAAFVKSGTKVTANDFLIPADILIVKDTPELDIKLKRSIQIDNNFFVVLNDKVSPDDKEKIISFLQDYGMISTYNDILRNTNEYINQRLKTTFPIPLFFLFVSSISLISVSILFIYKKFNEQAVYFLCGSSRLKSYIYMGIGLSLINAIAGIVNVLVILNYHFLLVNKLLNLGNILLDNYSIIIIIVYIISMLLLTTLIPFSIFRKMSPLEVYRRNNE